MPWPVPSTGHASAQHGALGEPRLCCHVCPCLDLSWPLQHQLLLLHFIHHSCSWKQAAATFQATVPPSESWGSPGDQECMRTWPFPVSSACSALPEGNYSTCSHRGSPSRCLPLPANPPEASKQLGTPGSRCPGTFLGGQERNSTWLSHTDLVFQEGCSGRTHCQRATGWMRVTCPREEGRPCVCTPCFLCCHLLSVPRWKVSCLLQLQIVPGQHTQQDQDQVRTRVGANQGRVWRMEGKRQGLGNKIRLWLSTDLTLLLFHSMGRRSFYRAAALPDPASCSH